MKNMDYIGELFGHKEVNISKNSPNRHIVMSGISGSGKSVRIANIEKRAIASGETVLALDLNGTHEVETETDVVFISAQKDGINIKILDTSFVEKGEETPANLIEFAMEILCPRSMRGSCQLEAVREAIKYAIKNRRLYSSEMEAIKFWLESQDNLASKGAYHYLCDILDSEIFRRSDKCIQSGKMNIISLKGVNPKTQNRIVEILLKVLWKQLRIRGKCIHNITLEIDEFQNLDIDKSTILFQLLSEARKYGLRLILSTQTLTIFSRQQLAIINQAAVKLFFQQAASDLKKVADLIDSAHRDRWIDELRRLKVGQAITVGELELAGRSLSRPIITSSQYKEDEPNEQSNSSNFATANFNTARGSCIHRFRHAEGARNQF